MDLNAWGPILVAVVAAIPGALALYYQGKKDKEEADLTRTKDARDGLASIIDPLQKEVARLQARVAELEQALIDKTNQIGLLMQEGIDKDVKLSTLQYKLQGMQTRLASFEATTPLTPKDKKIADVRAKSEADISASIAGDVDLFVAQKEEIAKQTQEEVERIKSNSILNGSSATKEI